MFDVYTLLANQLMDIHLLLTAKIVRNPKFAPKWEVTEEQIDEKATELIVHELAPILSLVDTLRKLAAHHDRPTEQPTQFSLPGLEQPEN